MFCNHCGKPIQSDAVFCQSCGVRITPEVIAPSKRLFRSRYDKKIAGVCAGVADYFELDVTLVRVLWLLCIILGGTGFLIYVILWIVVPMEPERLYSPASTVQQV